MDSVTAAPIRTPPDVSADDGAAATAAEENVAAAADAAAEMAEHLTIGTDNANAATGPVDLGAEGDINSCKDCRTHTPRLTADIITKSFYCSSGKAYLFDQHQCQCWAQEDHMTMTGMYNMSDIFCVGCGATLGWKYVAAHDERSQL